MLPRVMQFAERANANAIELSRSFEILFLLLSGRYDLSDRLNDRREKHGSSRFGR